MPKKNEQKNKELKNTSTTMQIVTVKENITVFVVNYYGFN